MNQEQKLQSADISGEEKENYLSGLNKSLGLLSSVVREGMTLNQKDAIKRFADENKWDLTRLPDMEESHRITADLIDRIIQGYKWFSWDNKNPDASQNKGYFKKIGISVSSGLPWFFDFVTLGRLKKEAEEMLRKIPHYRESALTLQNVLMQDYVETGDVSVVARKHHEDAMKRSFLEKLADSELIGWEQSGRDIKMDVRKTIDLGGETFWNISFAKYSAATGMFEVYVMDVWQDNLGEPHLKETEAGVRISNEFKSHLGGFGIENPAYFVLEDTDERFETIHPVHVSKSLVGPYENKYLKAPRFSILPGIREHVTANPFDGALRFCKSYFYAPNHRDVNGKARQILGKRENWNEQIVVCPGGYSSSLSKELLGTDLKIVTI
jgi:hypothetical protein